MIYLIISTIIDLLLSTNITNTYQNLNYFFPLILITSLPISYLLTKNKIIFFIAIIIIGIIYDLLYSDIPLINLYFLILLTLLTKIFYQNKKPTTLNITILTLIGVITYDLYLSLILILTKTQNITINDIIYKETHSLILNIIYLILFVKTFFWTKYSTF